ncbi:histone-like nucleoid-structuring protein Lsr2 [Sinosporangium siamense]|uniref:Nucleoid-associated protein Lsr2 n=1 Tax=Sinosporangium siamense TaxID=1367973 RepID=A0A919RG45_9ACTN|nr:Lsr2 family protein [Sinosporangium siamense]GII92135.1 nucleoid-associated protein Lsr2 [Sinosporangium siamense]
MAKQIREILIDDLDGGTGNETVSFAIDGTSFEIDLSTSNAKKLRKALQPYVSGARKVRAGRGRGRRGRAAAGGLTREQSGEIREWAKKKGLDVSARGRIARAVIDQYNAAH